MELILGIDLGTTYSCVAWVDETGKPQIIKNKEGFLTTPSVVFFRSKTEQEVGDAAKQYAVMYPDRVVSQIKRHMGEAGYSVFMDGADLRPEEISAHILRKLVQDAVTTLREEGAIPPDEPERIAAVITCPAYFGAGERHATRTAGELAGLRLLAEPVNEPTAAATLFGVLQQGDTRNVLVYDLGGGTFDVTIIHVEPGLIDVVCTGGDHHRGGVDWDKALMELALHVRYTMLSAGGGGGEICSVLRREYGVSVLRDPGQEQLRRADLVLTFGKAAPCGAEGCLWLPCGEVRQAEQFTDAAPAVRYGVPPEVEEQVDIGCDRNVLFSVLLEMGALHANEPEVMEIR